MIAVTGGALPAQTAVGHAPPIEGKIESEGDHWRDMHLLLE